MNTRTRWEKCKTCGEWSKVYERTGSCVDVDTCLLNDNGVTQADLDQDRPTFNLRVALLVSRECGPVSQTQVNNELGRRWDSDDHAEHARLDAEREARRAGSFEKMRAHGAAILERRRPR